MWSIILNFLVISLLLPEAFQELTQGNFRNFVSCLHQRGLRESSIVGRGDSRAYRTLNYQEQEYPGQILPLAFILPENEEDVKSGVICGRNHSVHLVPKSGGHSGEKYSFGDRNSVVVDLGKLNSVEVDKGGMRAVVGAGTLLGPLLQSLWTQGRHFIPTGSCPTVGIGGHATGGGHGFLARTYGLAVDHIVEIRIVTWDGSLLTVNSGQNSDLFWALRGGGGGSFGIVTSFLFRIQQAPSTVLVGTVKFTLQQFPEAFLAWEQFTLHGSRNVSGEFNIFPDRGIEIYLFDPTGVVGNFEKIESTFPPSLSRSMTSYSFPQFLYYQSYNFTGEFMKRRKRDVPTFEIQAPIKQLYPVGKSFYVQKALDSNSMETLSDIFKEQPQTVTVRFESYGGAINDIDAASTAFVHRKGRLALAVVNLEPNDSNSNSNLRGMEWMKKFFELGKSIWGQLETYQNYVDGSLPDYLQRYYGTNLQRLVQIKRKYDPHNYFNQPQSIPSQL